MKDLFDNDTFALFAAAAIIFVLIAFCFFMYRFLRSRGGFKIVMFGATDSFYNRDQRKAIEVVVNKDAGKKEEEQSSAEPKLKGKMV